MNPTIHPLAVVRSLLIPLALATMGAPAAAQQPAFTFKWGHVIDCAHWPLNDPDTIEQIEDCQALLAARHEGWVDGHAGKPDLFDPTEERETPGEKTEQ